MKTLPKVPKTIDKALRPSEKVKSIVVGAAVSALVGGMALPTDADAAVRSADSFSVQKEEVLLLEPAISSQPEAVAWHYSHRSHYSHSSHYSHRSHYSHYSSR